MKEFINFNGEITEKNKFSLKLSNRAFRFGDSIFETIKIFNGKIIFLDEHYNRLIETISIVKMNLPEHFTKDFFSSQILNLLKDDKSNYNARVRFTVFRKSSSDIYFVDSNNSFDFVIEIAPLNSYLFKSGSTDYSIDIFEDIKKPKGILSQIKSNNVLLHSIAGSMAVEKSLNNIVLVNEDNCITEAVNANIFIVKDEVIITPKLSDGCVAGIMRNTILDILETQTNYRVEQKTIHKGELLICDEVFLTNSIIGIQGVRRYGNREYSNYVSTKLFGLLNNRINSLMDLQES